jgi:hypothetical protein
MARQHINHYDRENFAGEKGYDDSAQRKSFLKMVSSCKILNQFLYEYFSLKNDKKYEFIEDPFGKTKVDMGMVCIGAGNMNSDVLVGLVEVDYYSKWKDTWPSNYKYCNRLVRKEKYYKPHPELPYINITFNVYGTDGILTTKEMHEKYPIVDQYISGVCKMDQLRRVSLNDAIKVGNWAKSEP